MSIIGGGKRLAMDITHGIPASERDSSKLRPLDSVVRTG